MSEHGERPGRQPRRGSGARPHLLLVEDDDRARMLLATVLEGGGYQVTTAPSGERAIEILAQQSFDIVVTDIKMRRVDGIQVLSAARQRHPPPSVILLTGFGSLETAIAALRAGAHDYLLKPCAPPDLLASVEAAMRRRRNGLRQVSAVQTIFQGLDQLRDLTVAPAPDAAPAPIDPARRYTHVGLLSLDHFRHTASFGGQALHMTPIEYALLCCLAEAQGRMLSYREIVRRTHGYDTDDAEAQALLKSHVRNLRRKIDSAYIVNVRGAGYMLVAPEE